MGGPILGLPPRLGTRAVCGRTRPVLGTPILGLAPLGLARLRLASVLVVSAGLAPAY